MQPPADNPAAANPNILATPLQPAEKQPKRLRNPPGVQSRRQRRNPVAKPPADNPAENLSPFSKSCAKPRQPRGRCNPGPRRKMFIHRILQVANPPRITPPPSISEIIRKYPGNPAGVLSLASGVNQRNRNSGCNQPRIFAGDAAG